MPSATFSLSEFRSKVLAPQRSNRFEVVFNNIPGVDSTDLQDLKFLAEDVTFPVFEFGSYSTLRYGAGLPDVFPTSPKYKEVIVGFIMEQGGKKYDLFRKWVESILPMEAPVSNETQSVTRQFSVAYKDDYKCPEVKIRMLSETGLDANAGEWNLVDVWPLAIMGNPLDWTQADNYATFQVTFIFYQMNFTPGTLPTEGPIGQKMERFVTAQNAGTTTLQINRTAPDGSGLSIPFNILQPNRRPRP